MQLATRIEPCLWFHSEAEEAVQFYTSIFPNSSIDRATRYSEVGKEFHGMEPGTLMTQEFTLDGHPFLALNGGPMFTFNEAVSFMVLCEDQAEIDYYWDRLTGGDKECEQMCGWVKDKFGLSWQVIPRQWGTMMSDPDQSKAQRAMTAVFSMKKIELAEVLRAFEGVAVES